MAELTPYPFPALVRRMFRELEADESIFQLPARRFFRGAPDLDLGVSFHGQRAASPLGPAAGPHTQMAQNLVLAWVSGSRILELKTVQILDELVLPRPCIDMRTVGYNAEWSQELKLRQSLEEYVKGAMLIEMLAASGRIPLTEGAGDHLFDLSVGYDLAGIRSPEVRAFIDGMLDASEVIEHFRAQLSPSDLPPELAHLRDLDFPRRLSNTVTLSTFHGCPPDEIEAIMEHLMDEHELHAIVKLNPMLLGPERVRHLLHDELGYDDIRVPDSAFERDPTWEQATGIVERLRAKAARQGLGFGIKLTNTLIVENRAGFLPSGEEEVYLSGPPLHVLAMHLVRRFRRHFGGELPISFSAGIDRTNFPDAVALGLTPITVCSDLLKKGGYGRTPAYYTQLRQRMEAVGAKTVEDWIRAYPRGMSGTPQEVSREVSGTSREASGEVSGTLGEGEPAREEVSSPGAQAQGGKASSPKGEGAASIEVSGTSVMAAQIVANTESYVAALSADPRYSRRANQTQPPKIGRHLRLFNCLTCDLCIPVCPNDANFTLHLDREPIPIVKLQRVGKEWVWAEEGEIDLTERHQIANFADFCNDCGNCDVFCPEDGGPYVIKPRFFRREEDWREERPAEGAGEGGEVRPRDGFLVERGPEGDRVLGRTAGQERSLMVHGSKAHYREEGAEIALDLSDPRGTARCSVKEESGVAAEIDLTWCFILDRLRRAVLDNGPENYVRALYEPESSSPPA